jgi:hypothetical protein
LQVEPLIRESIRTTDANRASDIGRSTSGDQGRHQVTGGGEIGTDIDDQFNRVLAGIEVSDDLILGGNLFFVCTCSEANQPGNSNFSCAEAGTTIPTKSATTSRTKSDFLDIVFPLKID